MRTRVPKYKSIADKLAQRISRGSLPVGTVLTEEKLATSFRVGRHTLRDAVRLLKIQGLVSQHPGVGTWVTAREPASPPAAPDFVAGMQKFASDLGTSVQRIYRTQITKRIAEQLDLPEGENWLCFEAVRYTRSDMKPIGWNQLYLDGAFEKIRDLIGTSGVPTYKLIEHHFGQRTAHIRQKITACKVETRVAKALKIKARSLGIRIDRHYVGTRRNVVLASRSIHPSIDFSVVPQADLQAEGSSR